MKGDFFFIGDSFFVNLCDIGEWLVVLIFFIFFVNSKLIIGDFLGISLLIIFFFLISKRDLVLEFIGFLLLIIIKFLFFFWDFWILWELCGGEGVLFCWFLMDVMFNLLFLWFGDKVCFCEYDLIVFLFFLRFFFLL